MSFPSFTFPTKVYWFQSTFKPVDSFDLLLGDTSGSQGTEAQKSDVVRAELPDLEMVVSEP